jgi:hypothetical protein
MDMKKAWEAPKLIVLVRSKPEESLTNSCKGEMVQEGPNFSATACYSGTAACTACVAWADS